jgi:hypothetical protein
VTAAFGTAEQVAEKVLGAKKMRAQGLKPAMILEGLRGAEAPLFHVTVGIREFFRSL